MTKEKLWATYVQKNPKFAVINSEITLTGKGLKKLFDQTYDHGFKQGKEVMNIFKDKTSSKDSNMLNEAFKDVFGKNFGI